MAEFTQGICFDGAAVLKDGKQMTIEEIIRDLKKSDEACDAVENILEYNTMIPLHTKDSHALHFVEQIDAWCEKVLETTE